jgi:hypothetical protein
VISVTVPYGRILDFLDLTETQLPHNIHEHVLQAVIREAQFSWRRKKSDQPDENK